jgi:chaperone required for assembly of F1-ATPase
MKRFYKKATAGAVDGRYTVLLDGKAIRTPAKAALSIDNKNLAEAVAKEWDSQIDLVKPETMPLMQFAATAIDRVTPQRQKVIEDICAYAGTDLICYRAEHPQDLVRKQSALWDPMVDWAKESLGVVLKVTQGIHHIAQPGEALAAARKHVEELNDLELTALYNLTSMTGSLIIALAIHSNRLSADDAFDISELDETHVIELWGEDKEAAERRHNIKEGMRACEKFLSLCKE